MDAHHESSHTDVNDAVHSMALDTRFSAGMTSDWCINVAWF